MGGRVLLTRTRAKGAGFARALERLCAAASLPAPRMAYAPIHLPHPVQPTPTLVQISQRLGKYEWVSFTSANAVTACTELAGGNWWGALAASPAQVACVGDATAAALRGVGITPALIPAVHSAAGMLAEFPAPAGTGAVLVCEGESARPTLREGLARAGYRVGRAVVYRMEQATAGQLGAGELTLPRARQLISGAGKEPVGCVVATAPSLLHALAGDTPGVFPPVAAIGASTATAARELGLEHAVAASPAPEDLAAAAMRLLHPQLITPSAITEG